MYVCMYVCLLVGWFVCLFRAKQATNVTIICFVFLGRPTLHDTDRLRTLINMLASDLAMSIAYSGHSYATTMAASSLTPAGQLSEVLSGLTQVSTATSTGAPVGHCSLFRAEIRVWEGRGEGLEAGIV